MEDEFGRSMGRPEHRILKEKTHAILDLKNRAYDHNWLFLNDCKIQRPPKRVLGPLLRVLYLAVPAVPAF